MFKNTWCHEIFSKLYLCLKNCMHKIIKSYMYLKECYIAYEHVFAHRFIIIYELLFIMNK